ncbi:emerin [Strigops habroptila]|uniref:emerin n=1 Tax=Strigops habroptila TaxID=2489341 RepID=UPI0011CF5834|nr:emerin [Strigops habroptila]
MQNYRGLTDKELLEKLKSYRIPHGALQGSTRKLYEKKIYEFETRRCRRGGGDGPDHDGPPLDYGGAARAWQPITERFRGPPGLMEEEQRLDPPSWGPGGGPLPREPLRPPPPPPPPTGLPRRLLPLRPQLLALGLLVALLVLLHFGGGGGHPRNHPPAEETPP